MHFVLSLSYVLLRLSKLQLILRRKQPLMHLTYFMIYLQKYIFPYTVRPLHTTQRGVVVPIHTILLQHTTQRGCSGSCIHTTLPQHSAAVVVPARTTLPHDTARL